MEPEVFDLLEDDSTILERGPLEEVVRMGQLMVYKHHGFWQCMDTLRDLKLLEQLWQTEQVPWKFIQ